MLAGVLSGRAADGLPPGATPDQWRAQAIHLFRDGARQDAIAALKQARTGYEAILAADPNDYHAVRGLAMTLFDLGEYEESRALFHRATTMQPDEAAANAERPVQSLAAAHAPAPAGTGTTGPLRGINLLPDVLCGSDPKITQSNISAFINRVAASGANAVYVHAFAKPNASGAYGEAYFRTSLAPLRADILEPLSERLRSQGVAVFAIMPVLSLARPSTDTDNAMMVMSPGRNEIGPSQSWRMRLSPFNTNGLALMTALYGELAAQVPLTGIVFGDDAYLTDDEDLNPAAVEQYKEALALDEFSLTALDADQKRALAVLKVNQLESFRATLRDAVRAHQPDMLFAATLYAAVLHYPPSEQWLAQNYDDALRNHAHVLVLADPEMEELNSGASRWLMHLAECASTTLMGPEKTVFQLSTYSQRQRRWVTGSALQRLVRSLSEAGVRHVVLGPDDVVINQPRLPALKKAFQEGS